MKKLMLVAAATSIAALRPAVLSADGVSSENVVGYQTVTIKQGWNMLAVNFEKIGEKATVSIQDLIPGTTPGLTGNMDTALADQIQVYNPEKGSYTLYTLFYTTIPNPGLQAKNWKWVDVAGNIADKQFAAGDSFWYNKQGATEVEATFNGQVATVDQTVTVVNGWNMIGSKFPMNFNPNTLGVDFWRTSGAVGNMDTALADQIQVYNPEKGSYTLYTLFYTTIPNPGLQAKNWKWVDVAGNVVGDTVDVIKPGYGVWYRHQGSGLTFEIKAPTL